MNPALADPFADPLAPARAWNLGLGNAISLDQPRFIGILNLTPDSFSDGGKWSSVDAAVRHAHQLVEDGASIIDVGGESSRPGSLSVPADEQIRRTLPVIRALASQGLLLSIDTTLVTVARAALDAGARIINDVSAGLERRNAPGCLPSDEGGEIFALASQFACALVIMHRLREPALDSYSNDYRQPPVYDDVVANVADFLLRRSRLAQQLGVQHDRILIDPGLGFGKTVDQNLALVRHTPRFVSTGYPVLGAASRKSFLGALSGIHVPAHRDGPSVALSLIQYQLGVRIFRVHNVALHVHALSIAHALRSARPDAGTPNQC